MRKITQLRHLSPLVIAIAVVAALLGPTPQVATAQQSPAAGARYEPGCIGDCTSSGFVNLDGQSNVVLENLHISNPNGRCLSVNGASNITIKNSVIGPCATNQGISSGYETGVITIQNSNNIRLEGNRIEDIASRSTIHLRNNAVWVTNSPDVTIIDNVFRDIHSDISQKHNNEGNRAIGVNGGSPRFVANHNTFINAGRNALQYQRNYNVSGVEFSHNIVEGTAHWDTEYEDMINLYSSTGTASSPIEVVGNYLRFGGPSSTGTGLIVGDGNPSIGTNSHVLIAENVIVNPGHVGIGVAGGNSIVVRDNIVYSEHHGSTLRTAVGMYVNHFTSYGPTCSNISITNNRVFFVNQHVGGGTNHLWNAGNCAGASLSGNNFGDTSLSMAVWNPGQPQSRAAQPAAPAPTPQPTTTTTTTTAPPPAPPAPVQQVTPTTQPQEPLAASASPSTTERPLATAPIDADVAESAGATTTVPESAAATPSTSASPATTPSTNLFGDMRDGNAAAARQAAAGSNTGDGPTGAGDSATGGAATQTAPASDATSAPDASSASDEAPEQLAMVEINDPAQESSGRAYSTLIVATLLCAAALALHGARRRRHLHI